MVENKCILEQLIKFHKTIGDLEVKIKVDDKALLWLSLLSRSFENFKDSLLYGKQCIIALDEVHTTLRSKEFFKVEYLKIDKSGESLSFQRGRSEPRGMFKSKRFNK